jgi:hypothetical protein
MLSPATFVARGLHADRSDHDDPQKQERTRENDDPGQRDGADESDGIFSREGNERECNIRPSHPSRHEYTAFFSPDRSAGAPTMVSNPICLRG